MSKAQFLLSITSAQHFLAFPGFVRLQLDRDSDPEICTVEDLQLATLEQK